MRKRRKKWVESVGWGELTGENLIRRTHLEVERRGKKRVTLRWSDKSLKESFTYGVHLCKSIPHTQKLPAEMITKGYLGSRPEF